MMGFAVINDAMDSNVGKSYSRIKMGDFKKIFLGSLDFPLKKGPNSGKVNPM
jgi:hypothetical protein